MPRRTGKHEHASTWPGQQFLGQWHPLEGTHAARGHCPAHPATVPGAASTADQGPRKEPCVLTSPLVDLFIYAQGCFTALFTETKKSRCSTRELMKDSGPYIPAFSTVSLRWKSVVRPPMGAPVSNYMDFFPGLCSLNNMVQLCTQH